MTRAEDSPSRGQRGRRLSELDQRILRLATKYRDSADSETAAKLATAVYPSVFSACYDLGGGLGAVSESVKAVIEAILGEPGNLLDTAVPTSWVRRRAYGIAAERLLERDPHSRPKELPKAPESAPVEDLTGPRLSDHARRGMSALAAPAKRPDAAQAPAVREALDALPPRLRVALVLETVSPLDPDEIGRIFTAAGLGCDTGDALTSLVAAAALSVFEHLGQVNADYD